MSSSRNSKAQKTKVNSSSSNDNPVSTNEDLNGFNHSSTSTTTTSTSRASTNHFNNNISKNIITKKVAGKRVYRVDDSEDDSQSLSQSNHHHTVSNNILLDDKLNRSSLNFTSSPEFSLGYNKSKVNGSHVQVLEDEDVDGISNLKSANTVRNIIISSCSTSISGKNTSPQKIRPLIQMNKSPIKQAINDSAITVNGVITVKSDVICSPVTLNSSTKFDQQNFLLFDITKRVCLLTRAVGITNVNKIKSLPIGSFCEFKLLQTVTSSGGYMNNNNSSNVQSPMKPRSSAIENKPAQYRVVDGTSIKELSNTEVAIVKQDIGLRKIIHSFQNLDSFVNVKSIDTIAELIQDKSAAPISLIALVVKVSSMDLPPTATKNRETHTVQIILTDSSSHFIQLNIYDESTSERTITEGDLVFLYNASIKYGGYQNRNVIQLSFSQGFYNRFPFLKRGDQSKESDVDSKTITGSIKKSVTLEYYNTVLIPLKKRYNDKNWKFDPAVQDLSINNLSRPIYISLSQLKASDANSFNDYIVRCKIGAITPHSFTFYYICNHPIQGLSKSLIMSKCKAKLSEQQSGEYKCKYGHVATASDTTELELGAIMGLVLSSLESIEKFNTVTSESEIQFRTESIATNDLDSEVVTVEATAFTEGISKLTNFDFSVAQQDEQEMERFSQIVDTLPGSIVILRIKQDKEERYTIQDVIHVVRPAR